MARGRWGYPRRGYEVNEDEQGYAMNFLAVVLVGVILIYKYFL